MTEKTNDSDLSPLAALYEKTKSTIRGTFKNIFSYWKTRKAIISGNTLWSVTDEKARSLGYLGAWQYVRFHLAITAVFSTLISYFFAYGAIILYRTNPYYFEGSDSEKYDLIPDDVKIFSSWFLAYSIVSTVVFPSIVSWVAARGALKSTDRNDDALSKARRAYLYIRTANGFWSGLILVFLGCLYNSNVYSVFYIIIGKIKSEEYDELPPIFIVIPIIMSIAIALAIVRQLYLSIVTVPNEQFKANGYSIRIRTVFQRSLPTDPPRMRLYLHHVLIGYPLFCAALAIFFIAIFVWDKTTSSFWSWN